MMFGAMGNRDHDECVGMVHRALDAGINFVDTADVYSLGESEEIVGRALKGRRDDVVLATKCFTPMGDERNHRGGSRRWIVRAVEDSLRRLDTDHIDLYQVHRHDWTADVDETLGALSDLVHQGKVLYLGSSGYPADWIVEAQWVAERRNRERFVCEQPPVLDLRPLGGGRRAAGVRALRHGRHPLEPPGRRLAHRQVPPRPGGARRVPPGGHRRRSGAGRSRTTPPPPPATTWSSGWRP